ncbi:RING-box protein 2, partial [Cyphomyrmex costatus]
RKTDREREREREMMQGEERKTGREKRVAAGKLRKKRIVEAADACRRCNGNFQRVKGGEEVGRRRRRTGKRERERVNACLRCQAESKKEVYGRQDCVVVWGECNHSFHYCCMSLWVKQNNRCPLCQQEWSIQRMGK